MTATKAPLPEPQLYTVRAAAALLGVGMTSAWKMISNQTLESTHIMGRRMIRAESLHKLIAEGTPKKTTAAR